LALESIWDLPSLWSGATVNIGVTVPGARRGDFADALLDNSSITFVLGCRMWSNNRARVTARNASASKADLATAPLAVRGMTKRQVVWRESSGRAASVHGKSTPRNAGTKNLEHHPLKRNRLSG
jgi:hypothetical protein